METIIFCFIVVAIIAFYAYANLRGREVVCGVEAGPLDYSDYSLIRSRSFVSRPLKIRDTDGKIINTQNYIRVVVCGNCMAPRKILDNSQLYVEKIDRNRPVEEQIKKGDIIMIYLKENNINKIRVFEDINSEKKLRTYYYDQSQEKKYSSRPHAMDSVVGIVRYII